MPVCYSYLYNALINETMNTKSNMESELERFLKSTANVRYASLHFDLQTLHDTVLPYHKADTRCYSSRHDSGKYFNGVSSFVYLDGSGTEALKVLPLQTVMKNRLIGAIRCS
jgi:hypothetical protein